MSTEYYGPGYNAMGTATGPTCQEVIGTGLRPGRYKILYPNKYGYRYYKSAKLSPLQL